MRIKNNILTHKQTDTQTDTHRVLPSEQPLVDGGQWEHLEQQPNGEWEEDEGEGLNKEVKPHVKQRTGQLLHTETETFPNCTWMQHCMFHNWGQKQDGSSSPPFLATGRCWRRWARRRCTLRWPPVLKDLTDRNRSNFQMWHSLCNTAGRGSSHLLSVALRGDLFLLQYGLKGFSHPVQFHLSAAFVTLT